MEFERIVFSGHAIRRMFERSIPREHVLEVLQSGEVINEYPEDVPYPSRMVLGYPGGRPLHVVIALAEGDRLGIVITVYEPDPRLWEPGFRRRRPA